MPPETLVFQSAYELERNSFKGYPDGTFKPQAEVTYAESLAMIIRALGYEPTLKGSWPTKYLIKAAELDISKGVAVNANAPALRGDVAVFVDNSLTVPKVIQVGFGDEAKYVVSGTPDYPTEETLLSKNLGFNKIEGRVVNNSFTDSDLDEDEIELSDGKIYTLPEGTGALALLGLEVKVWADDDRNIAAYEVKTEADKVIYDTVAADATNDKVELKVKDKEYSWATDPSVYVNFDARAKTDVDAGMYGRFVLDSKGKVAFACVFKFDLVNAGLVTESSESKVKYLQVASKKEIKFSNYEDGVYIFGPQLSSLNVEDIKADSVIYGWADGDKLYLIVAGDKAEGELSTATSSKVTLAGKKYNLSEVAKTYSEDKDETVSAIDAADDLENLLGENVVAILDINGEVRHIRGEAAAVSGLQFGIALNGSEATLDAPAKIKVLTKDGETVTYPLAEDVDFPANWVDTNDDKDTTLDNTPIAFKLNADGEIAELYFGLGEGNTPPNYESLKPFPANGQTLSIDKDDDVIMSVDGNNDVTARAYVTSATAIFSKIGGVADKEVKALSWADIEGMATTNVQLQVVRKIGDAVLVYFTSDTPIAVGEKYGVVLASAWLTSDGWKVKVDVFGEGEKEYLLSSSNDSNKFKEGHAIKFTLDAKGKINAPDPASSGVVTDISGSYIEIDDTDWVRVADNAVMYKLDEDNKIDVAITVGDLAEDDTINYVLDKNGKIAALVVPHPTAPEEEVPEAPNGLVFGKRNVGGDWYVTVLTQGQLKEYKVASDSTGPVAAGDFLKPTAIKFKLNSAGEMVLESIGIISGSTVWNAEGSEYFVSFPYRAYQAVTVEPDPVPGLLGWPVTSVTEDSSGNVTGITLGTTNFKVVSTSKAYVVTYKEGATSPGDVIVSVSATSMSAVKSSGAHINIVCEDDTAKTVVAVLIWQQ